MSESSIAEHVGVEGVTKLVGGQVVQALSRDPVLSLKGD